LSNDVQSTWLRIFCAFFARDKALDHLSSEGLGFWTFAQHVEEQKANENAPKNSSTGVPQTLPSCVLKPVID